MPSPKDIHQLRAALGLFSYYRKFVPHFASIAAPLNKLLRNDIKWLWKNEQEHAFQNLKVVLCAEPILRRPDLKKDFLFVILI